MTYPTNEFGCHESYVRALGCANPLFVPSTLNPVLILSFIPEETGMLNETYCIIDDLPPTIHGCTYRRVHFCDISLLSLIMFMYPYRPTHASCAITPPWSASHP